MDQGGHVCGWSGVLSGHDAHTHTRMHRHRLKSVLSWQDDEVVLQCVACIQKENRKFCLAAEGLGNRLCYLEPTSEAKVGTETAPLHRLILFDVKNIQWNTEMHVTGVRCLCSPPWSKLIDFIWWSLFSPRLYNQLHTLAHAEYNQQMIHGAVCRKVKQMKGCIHRGKSSMETKHPFSTSSFRSSKDSVKPSGDAQRGSSARHQSWNNSSHPPQPFLMSFSSEGFRDDVASPWARRQMIIPGNYAPGRVWWIVS